MNAVITSRRRLTFSALLTALLASLTLIGVGEPAYAAACTRGTGVTVVVQGHGMNSTTCVPGGAGKSATANLQSAGYSVVPEPRNPGTVCQINGKPKVNECWGVDSYWGFFTANGSGGGWSYATMGPGAWKAGAGDWVGFRFQDSESRVLPSVTPVGPASSTTAPPKPKPAPTTTSAAPRPAPKPAPTQGSTTPGSSVSPKPAESKPSESEASDDPTEPNPDAEEPAKADDEADDLATAPTTDRFENMAASSDDTPWPTIVSVAVVLVIAAAIGFSAFRRRRS